MAERSTVFIAANAFRSGLTLLTAAVCVLFMHTAWKAYGLEAGLEKVDLGSARHENTVNDDAGQVAFSKASGAQIPFVVNEGQINNPRVRFYARTFGGTIYVTDDGQIVYAFPKFESRHSPPQADAPVAHDSRRLAGTSVFREALEGAARKTDPEGVGQVAASVNWFIGNDASRWKSGLRSYEMVNLGEVYEGIEFGLRAYGNNVEKIFTVHPGADPGQIKIRVQGVDHVTVLPDGELELMTSLGSVRFTAPVAYQNVPGPQKQPVRVAYAVEGNVVGFEVGSYDRSRPLVIDPLVACTFLGGGGEDVIRAMAIHSWTNTVGATNIFVAGYTASSDFPATNGVYTNYAGGSYDAFISKFDGELANLLSSTFLGGSEDDKIYALVVNTNDGSVIVAGYTESSNFPTNNAYQPAYNGAGDAFVSMFNSNLTSLSASTFLGGTNVDVAYGVGLGTDSCVYVTGCTSSTNFPTNNVYGPTYRDVHGGSNDAFVVKLTNNLSALMASTFIGGDSDDEAYALVVQTNNNVFVAGYTLSTNFPATGSGYYTNNQGCKDMFIAMFYPDLTNTAAATYLGGDSNDVAYGIGLGYEGYPYVVGYTESTNFPQNPTNNAFAPGYTNRYMGGKDGVVSFLHSALSAVLRSTYVGGTGDDVARAIHVDSKAGITNIYVTGYTSSSNFPVTTNAYDTSANGGNDAFLFKLHGNLTNMVASTYLGGNDDDTGYALAMNAVTSRVFVAGATRSANFPVTFGAYQVFPCSNYNGFVSKLGSELAYGTLKWKCELATAGGPPSFARDGTIYVPQDGGVLSAVDANGNLLWEADLGADSIKKSAPAIGSNGLIYVCSHITPDGTLFCVTNMGAESSVVWSNRPGTAAFHFSPALGTDGKLYVGNNSENKLHVFNSSGTEVSNWSVGASVIGSPVIGTNGRIYLADAALALPRVYSWNSDGSTNWVDLLTTADGSLCSSAIGSTGEFYVAAGGSLLSLDCNTGATNWVNNLDGTGNRVESSPVIGTNGSIYVGSSNGNFYSISAAGATNWTRALGGVVRSSAAIGENGTVYIGSDNSKVYAFNPDGGTTWVFTAGAAIGYSAPLIANDGTVIIAAGANLYAIFGKEAAAEGVWPVFQHDQLRTRNASLGISGPAPPTNVTASVNLTDRVRVSWTGVADASLYEVWRCSSNSVGSAVYIGSAGSAQYDDGFVTTGYNYYYWVKSKNALMAGSLSSPGALGGVPTLPPENVNATDGFPTNLYQAKVQVSWTPCSGAIGYHVFRNTQDNTNSAVVLGTTSATNYDDTTLSPGITNYYWVNSHNLTTTSGLSTVTTGGIAPSAPTNVYAVQGTTTNYLRVTWNAPPGATVYRVYRGTNTDLGIATNLTNDLTSTVFNDVNEAGSVPRPCREYTYWVRATNVYGVSTYSASSTGYRALAVPLAVSATDGAFSNMVGVSWTIESTNTPSYLVFRNTSNDTSSAAQKAEVPFTDTSSTNYDDLEITRGLMYYYWVKAKNEFGVSDFGPWDTGGTAPMAPSGLSVSAGTYTGKVEVIWEGSTGATGYEVFRHTDVDSSQAALVGTSGTTNYDDITSAMPGVRYYYWVKATNIYGKSIFSGFDSGWRDLSAPTDVSASDGVSTSHLWVTWSTSVNATAYEVWRGTNSDSSAARELASDVQTNSYDDTDSTPGRVYYYWTKAKNATFTSGLSDYDSGYRALGYVDLAVSDFIFLPPVMIGGGYPDAVSFKLTNNGDGEMSTPNFWVTNNFYLSSNATFGDSDDVWIGGYCCSATLGVGDSTVKTLSASARSVLTIPTDATGTYYVFVRVDHVLPSTWHDPITDNNSARRFGDTIRIGATAPVPYVINDFSGDGKADLAVYHEASGMWFVRGIDGTAIVSGQYWGGAGFLPVIGDFDADGAVDMAVYYQATGQWYIRRVDSTLILWGAEWGGSGYSPIWGDYDGDGTVDLCVYHEATGTWYVRTVAGELVAWGDLWGGSGFVPVPGDYDGDGRSDLAVFLEGNYNWFVRDMSDSIMVYALSWGGPEGYVPVPGDYDGDGVADLAVYHEATGYWFILSMTGEQITWGPYWGGTGFTPVTGDYDGDGICDLALYHEATGTWYARSVAGDLIMWGQSWGGPGFTPVSLGQ